MTESVFPLSTPTLRVFPLCVKVYNLFMLIG